MAVEIIPISEERFYATCPECGGQEWLLPVNGPLAAWDGITGSECAACGYLIEWIVVEEEKDTPCK